MSIYRLSILSLLASAAIMFGLDSCSSSSVKDFDNTLRDAEMAVAAGDMVSARSVAETFTNDSTSVSHLSVTQLCRLSLVYMQLAEQPGYSDFMANAANCYHRAYELNADSAQIFFTRLVPPDQIQYARNLEHIVKAGEAEYDHSDPSDSLEMAVVDSIANASLND